MGRSDNGRRRVILVLLVGLCALLGSVLCGVDIRESVEPGERGKGADGEMYMPQGSADELPDFDVIMVRRTVRFHIIWTCVGLLAGGVIGFLVYLLLKDGVESGAERGRKNVGTRNLCYIGCFVVLFLVLWGASVVIGIRISEPIPDIRFRLMRKYLGVLSAVTAWVLVGRKIVIGRTLRRILNWVLLGVFNYVSLPRLNVRQQKVLWVGLVAVLYFLLFPPWLAFKTGMGGEGVGEPDFVGFHFVLSSQYDVLYDAPYVIASTSRDIQFFVVLGVIICTCLGIAYVRRKQDSTKSE